jgi:acyl-CoA thioesterase-1
MSWVIYFFGSGDAFFAGVGLVIAGVALFSFFRTNWAIRAATLIGITGLLLIGLSATPFPYGFYAGAGVVSLTWLLAERSEAKVLKNNRRWFRLTVIMVWLGGSIVEWHYHQIPIPKPVGERTLYIFADSVTAGMGSEKTWPTILAQSQSIKIQDHSQKGATVHSMVRKADKVTMGDGIILLEIGGNDLLGSTAAKKFEGDLDQLLQRVCRPGREVVMFELPLPPLRNEFGRIQRRLAEKYGVKLIPKRILVGVLTKEGATVDSIHLTPDGQRLMAETVWSLIQSATEPARREK